MKEFAEKWLNTIALVLLVIALVVMAATGRGFRIEAGSDPGDATRERCVADCREMADEDVTAREHICSKPDLDEQGRGANGCTDPDRWLNRDYWKPLYKPGTAMQTPVCYCFGPTDRGRASSIW